MKKRIFDESREKNQSECAMAALKEFEGKRVPNETLEEIQIKKQMPDASRERSVCSTAVMRGVEGVQIGY